MTATINGMGLTPSCSATPSAMGNTSTAAALLVITSVKAAVSKYTITNAINGDKPLSGKASCTIQAAAPLLSIALPKANDAPITTSTGKFTLTFMRERFTVTQRNASISPAATIAASSVDATPTTLARTIATRTPTAMGARRKSGGVESFNGLTSMKSRR